MKMFAETKLSLTLQFTIFDDFCICLADFLWRCFFGPVQLVIVLSANGWSSASCT